MMFKHEVYEKLRKRLDSDFCLEEESRFFLEESSKILKTLALMRISDSLERIASAMEKK